jgi:cephalosporin hydroxylase
MKKKFLNLKLLRNNSLNYHSTTKQINKSTSVLNFLLESNYNYLFDWMGIPVIQMPNDILVIQELIYNEKPDLILECGIGHGGMLVFYSSILNLIGKKKYNVIGVDIFIRKVNKNKIKKHIMSKNISLFESSSTNNNFINQFDKKFNKKSKKKIIFLDSNHTKDHVLEELNIYSKMIKKGEYIVVMDTVIDIINNKFNKGKPFGKGNSPMDAVKIFLKKNKNFKIDKFYENKSLLTVARNGFLKKIK